MEGGGHGYTRYIIKMGVGLYRLGDHIQSIGAWDAMTQTCML